jgi:hypothetical protein
LHGRLEWEKRRCSKLTYCTATTRNAFVAPLQLQHNTIATQVDSLFHALDFLAAVFATPSLLSLS